MQVIVLQPGEALESAKTHSSDLFFVHLGTLERRRLPTDPTSQPGDSPTIARYASGDFFGQLLSIDRRYCLSYTIVAENSVVLYKLDAKTFVKAASAATKQRRTACLPLFQVSGPLHGQFTSEPDRLIDCLEVESFQAGRPVPIADHPNHIWFVLTGRAEVVSVQSPPSDGLTDFPQCFQQMQYFCHKTITSHLRRDTEIQAGSGNLLTARIDLADFQRLGGRTDHLTLAINSPPVRRRPTTVSDLNLN